MVEQAIVEVNQVIMVIMAEQAIVEVNQVIMVIMAEHYSGSPCYNARMVFQLLYSDYGGTSSYGNGGNYMPEQAIVEVNQVIVVIMAEQAIVEVNQVIVEVN